MTFDWDDQSPTNDAMPWLLQLKEINPAFRCTLFAIPGQGDDTFWESHPDWVELAVHGHLHPDSYECNEWTYERMEQAIREKPARFVDGFKAPGWQISDDCYEALFDWDWWVADQHLEDGRRPPGLRTYFYEDGNYHGHTHNVCGNGIQESWSQVKELVANTTEFRFASTEAKSPWK